MIESTSQKRIGEGIKMDGAQWMEIRNNRLRGMSYKEIRKKCHIDQRTEKRYAE